MMGRKTSQGGWLLVGLALLGVWGCASEPPRAFPIYKPTAPFLAEQERVEKKAAQVRVLRGSERVRNVARHRAKNLAAWEPIYLRVRRAETQRERSRAAGLKAARNREAAMEKELKRARERRDEQ